MILAQMESIPTGLGIAAILYIAKSIFELYSQKEEMKDRKIIREQMISQTEVLRSIHDEQISLRDMNTVINSNVITMMERQLTKDQFMHVTKEKVTPC